MRPFINSTQTGQGQRGPGGRCEPEEGEEVNEKQIRLMVKIYFIQPNISKILSQHKIRRKVPPR